MKKHLKLIHIIIVCIITVNIFTINSIATIKVEDYKPNELGTDINAVKMGNAIIGGFQAIGSIVSVLALVITLFPYTTLFRSIGIKYMMGSVDEKAEYKTKMIYYIIGAILVFAISNISAMLYNFASTL